MLQKKNLPALLNSIIVNVECVFTLKCKLKRWKEIVSWHWQQLSTCKLRNLKKKSAWMREINHVRKESSSESVRSVGTVCPAPFFILIGRWERSDVDELSGVRNINLFKTESALRAAGKKMAVCWVFLEARMLNVLSMRNS